MKSVTEEVTMYKKGTAVFLVFCLILFTAGCEKTDESTQRGKDWDYTVVAVRDCPEDFLTELEEKKINPFQMTYMDGEYLYIAVGYGEQATGGFSISIHGLYESGEKLCLETELLGPGKDEIVKEKPSYPYVIVKTEKTEREVVFEY